MNLLHHLLAHPIAGILWALADLLSPFRRTAALAVRLDVAGERVHTLWAQPDSTVLDEADDSGISD